jgi:hypothetical protein
VKADGIHFGHFEMVVAIFWEQREILSFRKHEYYCTNDVGLIEVSQEKKREK